MIPHSETPAPLVAGHGGSVFVKAWTPSEYRIPSLASRELAIAHLARRFGLSRQLAAVVTELSGLGGRSK